MELFLPDPSGQDRKYFVKYNFYSMTRREAEEYMMSLESSARGAPTAIPMCLSKEVWPSSVPPPTPEPHLPHGALIGSTNAEPRNGSIPPTLPPPSIALSLQQLPTRNIWKT
jgi:hypothetical protein